MQLYPAIDIKGGQCVRLTQGLFDQAKVYAADPAEVAKLWKSQGATWLHLVDLDGALAGRSVNEDVIRRIVREVDLPVELGGGISIHAPARGATAIITNFHTQLLFKITIFSYIASPLSFPSSLFPDI